MSRLPSLSGDGNNWGAVLNDYLLVSHNVDGSLRSNAGQKWLTSDFTPVQGSWTDIGTLTYFGLAAGTYDVGAFATIQGSNGELVSVRLLFQSPNAELDSAGIAGGSSAAYQVPVSITSKNLIVATSWSLKFQVYTDVPVVSQLVKASVAGASNASASSIWYRKIA